MLAQSPITSQVHADVIAAINDVTSDYINTGVARLVYNDVGLNILSPTTLRPYLRKVAKEMKRPFLFTTEYRNYERSVPFAKRKTAYIELIIPRQKRTEPLIMGLMLAAHEVTSSYHLASHHMAGKHPVRRYQDGTNWYVTFIGGDAFELLNQLIEQWRTDPVTRLILKLPPRSATQQ